MGHFEGALDGDSFGFDGEKCTQHLYNQLFFYLLRFSQVLYSTHEKYISLALEQQKTVKLLHYNSITIRFRSIWWRLREIENLRSWRSRHFTYLGVFLSNSLSICTSPKSTHSFQPIIYTWRILEVSIQTIITNTLDESRDLFHDYHWYAYRFFFLTLRCNEMASKMHFSCIFPQNSPINRQV